jgi:hypothetical protein
LKVLTVQAVADVVGPSAAARNIIAPVLAMQCGCAGIAAAAKNKCAT